MAEPEDCRPAAPTDGTTTTTLHPHRIRESALRYLDRGWCPIEVKDKTKQPVGSKWPLKVASRERVDQEFDADRMISVGVLLGVASGGLIDLDLDCEDALELVDEVFPETRCVFGRPGNPRSHRLYRVPDLSADDFTVLNFDGPLRLVNEETGEELVSERHLFELRSNRHHTVFPPSIHETGEQIEWHSEGDPFEVASVAQIMGLADALKGLINDREPYEVISADRWSEEARARAPKSKRIRRVPHDGTEGAEGSEGQANACHSEGSEGQPFRTVERMSPDEVVEVYVCTARGQRHLKTPLVARGLKFNCGLTLRDARPHWRAWWLRSRSNIGEEYQIESVAWEAFVSVWDWATVPLDVSMVREAFEASDSIPFPDDVIPEDVLHANAARLFDFEEVRRLIRMAIALERMTPYSDGHFIMSSREVAKCIFGDDWAMGSQRARDAMRRAISRHLERLCEVDLLILHQPGLQFEGSGKANEYRLGRHLDGLRTKRGEA